MNCTDAEDLIYNRFDLIYDNIDEIHIGNYHFQVVVLDRKALINVWGKFFPQDVFDEVLNIICEKYDKIMYIEITNAYNNYKNQLYRHEDLVLYLPKDEKILFSKLKSKSRCNLKKKQRLIEEIAGKLTFKHMKKQDIDDAIVEQYFEWKKITHGRDYGLSPREYLLKYHITDALLMLAGKRQVAVVFYCRVNETVYLENLSYDVKYERYSPGFLAYIFWVKELIAQGVKILYLGGGKYSYKHHFDSVVYEAFSGRIYTNQFYNLLNKYMKKEQWTTYAIYGLGNMGNCFLTCIDKIHAKLIYGIDQSKKIIENVQTYVYQGDDIELENVDVVFITIRSKIKGLEDKLKRKYHNVFYWSDMIDIIDTIDMKYKE